MSDVISRVLSASDTATRDIGVEAVLTAIRTGGKKLRGQITQIRNRFESELDITGDPQKAKRAVEKLKKALPGVTWSGTFSYRASDKLLQHSGLLCADLDELGEKLPSAREQLQTSPHLFTLSLSPTGYGLKAVFRVRTDASLHPGSFRAVAQHVRELTGVEIDESGSDVSRLCFLSYDPELYHNPNAIELEPLPEPEKPKASVSKSTEGNSKLGRAEVREMLAKIPKRPEYGAWLRVVSAVGDCLSDEDAIEVLNEWSPEESRGEYAAKLRKRLKDIHVGTLIQLAKEHGWTPPSKAKVTSESSEETLTELTSLTSLADAEYPAPPDEAAYYGLAGDIVRRIEPHTEAAPVALLIQIIVAFGNAIGRNPHALADGARHAMNLSAVLVGETSKARKGTAWAHVRRLFKRADEQWAQDCIANGLSSGEGVIWAVRDPITRSVKNKTTGHYEDEISDAGIADKRLCVVEGEFANVLKVMTREGNTLSPVLRSAWDSGDLRSITKNSPARATDAHVSIIGHITRHELRRLLTETESANGSANRWLFIGVRRSKRLPEGGNIGSDSMSDLVTRLQKAIVFAQAAGKVTRNDEARALWARIYPELSEGKPGLLGAITARAEAQVLRLSVIYALLDCSNAVRVEHLKAALALWGYSERSAVWVFEMGTGNKNADKILAALKAAGQKGLTRLQITNEVFNRHATKFEIDEALRLLHSLKVADRKLEGTATRPAERWVYQAQRCEVCEQSTPEDGKTGDTSHYSHPSPSKNASSAESETEAETLARDESGVARL